MDDHRLDGDLLLHVIPQSGGGNEGYPSAVAEAATRECVAQPFSITAFGVLRRHLFSVIGNYLDRKVCPTVEVVAGGVAQVMRTDITPLKINS
jgi:hypothetical protein